MDDYVVWHVASDAGTAAELVTRIATAGLAAHPIQPGTALTPGIDGAETMLNSPVAIAVVSAASLADQRFDMPLSQRLDAQMPTLIALYDVSNWEFGLRRPGWQRRLDPAAVLASGMSANSSAWLDWLARVQPGTRGAAPRRSTPNPHGDLTVDSAPTSTTGLPAETQTIPSFLDPAVLFQQSSTPPPDAYADAERQSVGSDDASRYASWLLAANQEVEARAELAEPEATATTEAAPDAAIPAILEPAAREVSPPTIVPPRSRQRGRSAAPVEGRGALPASRPRPRRNPGCTCLLWAMGIVVGLVVLAILAFVALVVYAMVFPESAEPTPVGVAQFVATAEPLAASAVPPATPSRVASVTARPTSTRQPQPTSTTANQRLMRDTFGVPSQGLLPRAAPDNAGYHLAYEQGEYVIAAVAGATPAIMTAAVAGDFGNSIISVDGRLVGDPADRVIVLTCRDQGSPGGAGYSLLVNPDSGQAALMRGAGAQATPLVDWRSVRSVRQNNQTNRLELRCVGSTITGLVNSTNVATATDGTYRTGVTWLGATTAPSSSASEARFDNLSVLALTDSQ